ncbi:MAG: RNA methyltransferase [Spirochaetes bacterium]|nr:MAG: RNA methyltransferase [Spirochaetota bacterium]
MIDLKRNIKVILVSPRDGTNVGAVCRAMKTMGLNRLEIVKGKELDILRVATLAVHAKDVYDQAVFSDSLEHAISDSVLSAGITRRRGKWRKYFSLTPEELARKIIDTGNGTISLVFGNEEHGLTNEELSLCNLAVTIPSSPQFPSLNLSHAVQIITYIIYRESIRAMGGMGNFHPIDHAELKKLTATVTDCLEEIGFFTLTGKDEMGRFIRDIFARALLDKKEAERVVKIFKKIRGLKSRRRS